MTDKLQELANMAGLDMEEIFKQAIFDGVASGICINENCDYTAEFEPDQDRGWCEVCESNTVKSALRLLE